MCQAALQTRAPQAGPQILSYPIYAVKAPDRTEPRLEAAMVTVCNQVTKCAAGAAAVSS